MRFLPENTDLKVFEESSKLTCANCRQFGTSNTTANTSTRNMRVTEGGSGVAVRNALTNATILNEIRRFRAKNYDFEYRIRSQNYLYSRANRQNAKRRLELQSWDGSPSKTTTSRLCQQAKVPYLLLHFLLNRINAKASASRLSAFARSPNNQKLFGNTISLYVLQAINYIFPLITIPYLVRVLGTDIFGLIAFASSFVAYFQTIIDYGFNLSATREISIRKTDQIWLSGLFASVIAVKVALFVVCTTIFFLVVLLTPRFHEAMARYLWLYLGTAGSILFPTWLFQGMERMGYITLFNLLSKIVITCLYFVFIHKPSDYMWFAYLGSLGTCIINGISFVVAIRIFGLKLVVPSFESCKQRFKEGFQIFVSQASVTLFTNTNTFVLGLFTSNKIVGLYAIAEKIVRALVSMTGPVAGAIYPRVSVMFSESRPKALKFLRSVLIGGSATFGILSCCLFVLADLVVLAVTGSKSNEIGLCIRIMSFLPLSVFVDNIYGTQIMLNINLQKQFMQIILFGGMISVCLLFMLVPFLGATGSAVSFVVSQLTILICMILAVRKAGIHLLGRNQQV